MVYKQNQAQNQIIVSTNAEKSFDKYQHCFMLKGLKKIVVEGNYLSIIKAIYDNSTVNILLTREKLKFSLKSGLRQG
jgi:hypothetical protein